MSVSLSAKIVIPEDVLSRELEGESVILNLDTEKYYGLDDVGTRMLTVLAESNSVGEALEVLQSEYDVDPETLQRDLFGLIENLLSQGIIQQQQV